MEPQTVTIELDQAAAAILHTLKAKAEAQGVTLASLLLPIAEGANGTVHERPSYEEEVSLSGTPWEEVEHLLGVFDSREPFERPEIEQDAFTREVIADLARQGIKLP